MVNRVGKAPSSGGRPPTQGRVVGRMQREYRYYKALLDDPRTPTAAKWLIGGGVGYVLSPLDLIPDFIPIIGKLDDLLIAPAMIGLGMKLVPDGVKTENRGRSRRIRVLYDDKSIGPVLFESEALAGPFGIRIGACARDPKIQGPVLFPMLDLMFEYGLVVITDKSGRGDRFDGYTLDAASNHKTGPDRMQIQLDVNFRPLPLIAAVMYCSVEPGGPDRFVNSQAAYAELPAALKRRIDKLRLRWQPRPGIRLEGSVNDDPCGAHSSTHVISGAQLVNLLMAGECEIVDLGEATVDELLLELHEHVLQRRFCYTHDCSDGELIAWNPRHVFHVSPNAEAKRPGFVYPMELTESLLER